MLLKTIFLHTLHMNVFKYNIIDNQTVSKLRAHHFIHNSNKIYPLL